MKHLAKTLFAFSLFALFSLPQASYSAPIKPRPAPLFGDLQRQVIERSAFVCEATDAGLTYEELLMRLIEEARRGLGIDILFDEGVIGGEICFINEQESVEEDGLLCTTVTCQIHMNPKYRVWM